MRDAERPFAHGDPSVIRSEWKEVVSVFIGRVSMRCLLMGHDDVVRCESGRLFLECSDCRRSTTGWTIGRSDKKTEPHESVSVLTHARQLTAAS
jgi:hypothetical protein